MNIRYILQDLFNAYLFPLSFVVPISFILCVGQSKALALHKALECGVNHMWTVSAFQQHAQATFVAEEVAADELRVKTVRYFKGLMPVHDHLIELSPASAQTSASVADSAKSSEKQQHPQSVKK